MDGNRVRTKRRAQAESLTNLIQARQVADPNEHIVSIGDYNAYEFSDGYVDMLGTIKGAPTACDEVVLCSADLVDPNLTDLAETVPASDRYSYSFDGAAQVLDHELVTQNLLGRFDGLHYARNDADFPESFRNDPNRPERISDHDMAIGFAPGDTLSIKVLVRNSCAPGGHNSGTARSGSTTPRPTAISTQRSTARTGTTTCSTARRSERLRAPGPGRRSTSPPAPSAARTNPSGPGPARSTSC